METNNRIRRYEQAAALLPQRLRRLALGVSEEEKEAAEEFRLRTKQPMTLLTPEGERPVAAAPVEADELETMVSSLTEYSRYASLETLRQGYLCVRGGFRVGLCGTVVLRDGVPCNIKDLSALALRVVRERVGLAAPLAPALFDAAGAFQNTLLISPPGVGKTTLLRDLIRCLSAGVEGQAPLRVAVVDERGELAVSWQGCAQMDLGPHTDVLDGCPKALGIPMLLRAMNPQVIAVDELATAADLEAASAAAHCGAGLLASAHAGSLDELRRKPLYHRLIERDGVFEKAIVIERAADGTRRYRVEEIAVQNGACEARRAGLCRHDADGAPRSESEDTLCCGDSAGC